MRTPLIAGNWKMHKTVEESVALVKRLREAVLGVSGVDVVVAPPFTALHAVAGALDGQGLALAAQNMHWEDQGACTGEISAAMLLDVGCRYVILGHSERRQRFGETDDGVAKKAAKALSCGLTPIVCVGETLEEREEARAFGVVERQVRGGLEALEPEALQRTVLAYEPVWAIGTGRTASSAQAEEMHKFIRGLLASLGGPKTAEQVRVLYGGSVKPSNIAELMAEPDVDGALVGGASLEAETFASIVRFRV